MLQNQGWSEGEGLGAGSNNSSLRRRSDAHANRETLQEKRKKTRLDSLSPPAPAPKLPTSPAQEPATKEEQEEILIDDDDEDPIIEVRKKAPVPMIDLTQSDTTEDSGDDDDDDIYSPASSPAPPTASSTTAPGDPRAAQTALLTPLPTILKSDRLGIGLKAKTEGPYRSSVKRRRVTGRTRNDAAAEDLRMRRILLGKGHRAFARAERLERESRQNMMAYLSEP
jgi:G-patch domain